MLKQSEITLSAVLFSFFIRLSKTDKLSGGSFFESRLAKPMVQPQSNYYLTVQFVSTFVVLNQNDIPARVKTGAI